jgi:hypothetical protein
MDIVYVCRGGENEELRYSIRSVVANIETANNIWVVGDKPDWYSGNFVPVDNIGGKYDNIRNAIKVACNTPEISEDFILMNDDFFVTQKLNSVVCLHGGLLINRSERHRAAAGPNLYANLLARTDRELKRMGIKKPLDYDLHTPMIINKTNMLNVVDYKLSVRSVYGNVYNVEAQESLDVKVYGNSKMIVLSSTTSNGTPYLSSEDSSFNTMSDDLYEMFPDPSIYEYL